MYASLCESESWWIENALMLYRFPSLETRWLQRSEKWMTQPMVAVADDYSRRSGACYYHQGGRPVFIDGREISLRDAGLIVLRADYWLPEVIETAATIAHEWRHCWQQQMGFRSDSNADILAQKIPYETKIRRYFSESTSEADALRFEWEKTNSPLSNYWVGLVSSMTALQRAEGRVKRMEIVLTRFRLKYYIWGKPKRGCHRRHLKMVDYYLSLLATLKWIKAGSKRRGKEYVEQRFR